MKSIIHCLVSNGPVRDAHLKWPNEPKVGDTLDFPGLHVKVTSIHPLANVDPNTLPKELREGYSESRHFLAHCIPMPG